MNRRALTRSSIAVAILGLAFLTVPLFGSLRIGVSADASLPRIDVSHLQPGQPELRDHPLPLSGNPPRDFRWSLLLLRHADGTISAWNVLARDGKVAMPDIHWWQPFYTCERFELTVSSSEGTSAFKCNDSEVPSDYWRAEWQWSESGKALGRSVDDMQAADGVVEGNYFVVGKRG